MHANNPEKLQTVVHLLNKKKAEIDSYFHAYIFKPYGIDIKNCLLNQNFSDAKRLLDFSFTTRQGGQNKSAIENYEEKKDKIFEKLKAALGALVHDDWEPRKKYETSLALINSIEHIGQKIASMFIKFLVYHSKDFKGKAELERELFIPFDSHVARLLFTNFNGKRTDKLDLYKESINQASLYYDLESTRPITLKENKLVKLQRDIRADFDELKITEPPIILDYLWYVGMMYCSKRFGEIGCKICFLRNECTIGKSSRC